MRLIIAAALLLVGCHTPFGTSVRVTTPKPFTTPQLGTYEIHPDAPMPKLGRSLEVVVLPFFDGRKINRPGVDRIWSPDAESRRGRTVQPREIRGIIRRGLERGLKRWPKIRLISAEELAERRDAEVIVSGKIETCRVSASFVNYRAECSFSIDLRGSQGRSLLDAPIAVKGRFTKRIYERPADWRSVEPVPPNPLAPAVERAIENALVKLLNDAAFRDGFREAAH
ncbi:MAG: hypothetical protein COB53_04960 [Elusimicrobia bacterium]|nr:MAG: hypothetical protein COB53_04960 [Elusimicrobiota bacterium]